MISKLTTGSDFGGCLRYDTRQGQEIKPGLAKVLDVSGVEFSIDEKSNYIINTKQAARDFAAQALGYNGDRAIRKPVYHWSLSYHPDDKVSEEQMVEDAHDFLQRIGFDDTQYVMTAHYDKAHHHIHIVTNIVNNQGKRIPTMGLIDKAHAAVAAITKERGYIWGEKTKKENITHEKIHKPHDRAREVIEPMIREALAASTSFYDFKEKLTDYGIDCNFTVAKDGKRGRLSFCFDYEGQQHMFKGSAVARDLSFGYVKEQLFINRNNVIVRALEDEQPSGRPSHENKHKLPIPEINFGELMLLSETVNDFKRNLLVDYNAKISPINDTSGNCVDFTVSLAQEGLRLKASEMMPEVELQFMLSQWAMLTKEQPQTAGLDMRDKTYIAKFRKHFEEALTYNYTSLHQFSAIMAARGIMVRQAKFKGDPKESLVFQGLSRRGVDVTRLYTEDEVNINALDLVLGRMQQNKQEHKVQYREKIRVENIAKKLFEWSTSQQHYEKMLKKKGIDVVFSRAEDNPSHIIGATFVDHTVKTAFKASELDKSIAASVFDKAVESGHWKVEDTTQGMDEENYITEWQEDELATEIRTALNLLGKSGGPLFQNTHGNHAGKTKNQIAWEKQQAEEEQQAQIYQHRH